MNIIIPMAGEGTRVKSTVPKPLVEVVNGKPMIEMALESLNIDGHYCFIVRRYNNQDWNVALRDAIHKTVGNAVIVEIDYLTKGPAISVLHAPKLFFSEEDWNVALRDAIHKTVGNAVIVEIDYLTKGPAISALHAPKLFFSKEDLLVTNCDQIMHWNADNFIDFTKTTDADGAVVTYFTDTPKNSYAFVEDDTNLYPEFKYVREKQVISKYSLNGIHWWKRGEDFAKSVHHMVEVNSTVNGEYYVGPSYNYLDGIKRVYNIDPSEHFAVGTLEDIERYRKLYASKTY